MAATTAQKVAWILALMGLVLGLFGGFYYQTTLDSLALLAAVIGLYLLPLSMVYLVALTKDKHLKGLGILVGLAVLYAAYALLSTPIYEIATGPSSPPAGLPEYLFAMWPSILLLIVSIYSLVRRR